MAEDDKKTREAPPKNVAPDAVKDPNVKVGGKPGLGPEGDRSDDRSQGDEADPGSG